MSIITYPSIASSINIQQLGNSYFSRKTSWYVGFIPLNLIDYCKWDEYRYTHNLEKILINKTVKPVIIGDFDKVKQKYTLCDGNHRCYCSNELGYTYIPAIVSRKVCDSRILKEL